MCDVESTKKWLKSVFNINKEIDFEIENIKTSQKRLYSLQQRRKEIFEIINQVKQPEYKQILHKRYIQGEKWEDISEELAYELQHIHRLHKKAIYAVCELKKDIL